MKRVCEQLPLICFIACGNHGRTIQVEKMLGICFECKCQKHILMLDCSDGEYTPMKFCRECLNGFFDGKVSESTWSNDLTNEK